MRPSGGPQGLRRKLRMKLSPPPHWPLSCFLVVVCPVRGPPGSLSAMLLDSAGSSRLLWAEKADPAWCGGSSRGQRHRGDSAAWEQHAGRRPEETAAPYAVIAIVPVFCLMGLLGILVCNLLKRKGYHCTANKEVGPGPGGGGSGNNPAYGAEDANEDTIGVLVRLITEKKENAAALEELLKEYHSKQLVQTSHGPVPRPPPGPPSMPYICPHHHHLHTVQGLASLSGLCCSRCNQKWPEVLLSPEAAAAAAAAPTNRLLPNAARAPKAGQADARARSPSCLWAGEVGADAAGSGRDDSQGGSGGKQGPRLSRSTLPGEGPTSLPGLSEPLGSGVTREKSGLLSDALTWSPGSLRQDPGYLSHLGPQAKGLSTCKVGFRVARIPEQRTNSWASEVKTITEVGPSVGDFTDSPQPGLPTEQRALLGSSGSHTKWPKPPAEKKAEENRYVVRLSESNLVI
ncbi:hypothetical protein QTO34_003898 [Cnephaeus nilssonii]|uniref:Tumor necrosis factor receptor superfamily member 19L n=1 Tax=Cnephaeus nilssonii TaxID=3371016 RepID=A0AA40HRQ2_CNENI|nr:hypothetical protein QTO34_003898 [Eptesicus nilssonii]